MGKIGIVAFAFGAPFTIESNRSIAGIALKNAQEFNAMVYTQRDVFFGFSLGINVEYTEEEFGNPPPTLRIARGAIRWAKRRRLTELWIVAAKPHLWRVLRDIYQANHEVRARIEIHVCKEIEQYPEEFWFCPDSLQKRTRSRKLWNKRERILKFMPFFIYKLIAS